MQVELINNANGHYIKQSFECSTNERGSALVVDNLQFSGNRDACCCNIGSLINQLTLNHVSLILLVQGDTDVQF